MRIFVCIRARGKRIDVVYRLREHFALIKLETVAVAVRNVQRLRIIGQFSLFCNRHFVEILEKEGGDRGDERRRCISRVNDNDDATRYTLARG